MFSSLVTVKNWIQIITPLALTRTRLSASLFGAQTLYYKAMKWHLSEKSFSRFLIYKLTLYNQSLWKSGRPEGRPISPKRDGKPGKICWPISATIPRLLQVLCPLEGLDTLLGSFSTRPFGPQGSGTDCNPVHLDLQTTQQIQKLTVV